MLSKEERSALNTSFWTGFKKIMSAYKSSNGRSINWLNYPSDVKGVYIRMEVDNICARLCFDMQFKDEGIRALVWEQMGELKKIIESNMQHETVWIEKASSKEGFNYSRICWELEGVSLYNEDDYNDMYAFLKSRIVEFDSFYQEFKEIIINLVH